MIIGTKRKEREAAMERRSVQAEQELQKQIDELRRLVWQLQDDVHALKNREVRHEAE